MTQFDPMLAQDKDEDEWHKAVVKACDAELERLFEEAGIDISGMCEVKPK